MTDVILILSLAPDLHVRPSCGQYDRLIAFDIAINDQDCNMNENR